MASYRRAMTADAPDWRMSADKSRQTLLLEFIVYGGGFVDVAPFYDNDERRAGQAADDVHALEAEGWVNASFEGGGALNSIAAAAVPAGTTRVDRIVTLRSEKSARRWACRSALLWWLF